MKKYVFAIAQILVIISIVTLTYWITQKYIVFNNSFLEVTILSPLFYLFPLMISLSISLLLAHKFTSIPKLIQRLSITFVNTYLFLSVFMGTSKYCEDEKNMTLAYLIILWVLFLSTIYILIKYILPKLKLKDIIIIGVSTLLAYADFYFFFISLDLLYYIGWFQYNITT